MAIATKTSKVNGIDVDEPHERLARTRRSIPRRC
jgi:hypothetical protein